MGWADQFHYDYLVDDNYNDHDYYVDQVDHYDYYNDTCNNFVVDHHNISLRYDDDYDLVGPSATSEA